MDVPVIFVVPSCRKKNGTGHLRRAIRLVSPLGPEVILCLPGRESEAEYGPETLHDRFPALSGLKILTLPSGGFPPAVLADSPPIVILDLLKTPVPVFEKWLRFTPFLVGLDEGGPCRQRFPWLVDTLGTGGRGGSPNIRILPVEKLPPGPEPETRRGILVSFGGEDPAGLTGLTVRRLIGWGIDPKGITVVRGPLFREDEPLPDGITLWQGVTGLSGQMGGFRTLFTAYGLTAYEGIMAGLNVILANPSAYHRKLGRHGGFYTDPGIRRLSFSTKARLGLFPEEADRKIILSPFAEGWAMETLTASLKPSGTACPCCGGHTDRGRALYRKPDGSFFRCRRSGLIHFSLFRTAGQSEYSENYFFDQYRNQYGRTYLEDFDNIKRTGLKRISVIRKLLKRSGGDLLDIGCAYGPFLSAAAEGGFHPCGIDIAADAVRHVREVLGYPAMTADFPGEIPDFADGRKTRDVVTLWYVIEHFPDLRPVLNAIDSLLERGGVLAFSTPNARGISAYRNRRRFLENSPEDHFSVMDPRSVRKILKKYSFRIRKIVITGHHPERFFPTVSLDRRRILKKVLLLASLIFGLGDTFEVYAVKKGRK